MNSRRGQLARDAVMAEWTAGWTTEQFWFDSQHGQASFPQHTNRLWKGALSPAAKRRGSDAIVHPPPPPPPPPPHNTTASSPSRPPPSPSPYT